MALRLRMRFSRRARASKSGPSADGSRALELTDELVVDVGQDPPGLEQMANVYSIHMYAAHDLSGVGPDRGPAAGHLWIARDLDVVNGEAVNFVALVGSLGQLVWCNSFATPVGFDYASWRGRYVIEYPNTIHLETTAAADVTLSGYDLTLP